MQIFLCMDAHFPDGPCKSPDYLSQKMSELQLIPWSMEFYCMDSMPIFLCMDIHFVGTVHTNFHAKSGVCSSKNGRVIALGTKEDIWGSRSRGRRRSTFSSVDYTVQTSFLVRFLEVWTIIYILQLHGFSGPLQIQLLRRGLVRYTMQCFGRSLFK